jgi:hypothetical protein
MTPQERYQFKFAIDMTPSVMDLEQNRSAPFMTVDQALTACDAIRNRQVNPEVFRWQTSENPGEGV